MSKLALGTVQFGTNYGINNSVGIPNDKEIIRILDYAYKNGWRIHNNQIIMPDRSIWNREPPSHNTVDREAQRIERDNYNHHLMGRLLFDNRIRYPNREMHNRERERRY